MEKLSGEGFVSRDLTLPRPRREALVAPSLSHWEREGVQGVGEVSSRFYMATPVPEKKEAVQSGL
jgi:hypothetical protein